MKFKIEEYQDTQNITYAMHCKTVKEAESFADFLTEKGERLNSHPTVKEQAILKIKSCGFCTKKTPYITSIKEEFLITE